MSLRGSAPSSDQMSGWHGSPEYFHFVERNSFDPADIEDVLRGRKVGVIVRGIIPPQATDEILIRFKNSPSLTRREDDAPGLYLGAYHYQKATSDYLEESMEISNVLSDVLGFPGSPWRWVLSELKEHLAARRVIFRRAEKDGATACEGAVRSWETSGAFALSPHEDVSQCRDPKQADFEIQKVAKHEVCGLNLCLQTGGGGELTIWNIKPNEITKINFGTSFTGGIYPPSALAGIEAIRIEVRRGDVYILNGGHVHAVEKTAGERTTVASLMGFCDTATVVAWT